MANGSDVIRSEKRVSNKLLDASATNESGPWVNVAGFKKSASVHIKGASSWDGTVTVYGSNDTAEAGTGVNLGDNGGSGNDAMVALSGYAMVRAVQTNRTTGSVTVRYEGDRR